MINKNFIDLQNLSIRELEDFEKNNDLKQEFNLLYVDIDKIKSKLFLQLTKLKHIKAPVNQFPAYIDTIPADSEIKHLYIDMKYIELNNYLINLSPIIIDITNTDKHKFIDDTDYPTDRNTNTVYPNGWFYVYMGLNSNNELDIKISNQTPYRYGENESTPFYKGSNDPLYIYKNNIWYRCVSCFHYGRSNHMDYGQAMICKQSYIKNNLVCNNIINIGSNSTTTYIQINMINFLPANLITIYLHCYRNYVVTYDENGVMVFGGWMFHGTAQNTGATYYVEREQLIHNNDYKIGFRATTSGRNSAVYISNFTIQ